jgi:hypothetical protein
MSFFCRLTRKHYWCVPHRTSDNKLVQVCYECGAERPARELHNEIAGEWLNRSLATAKAERVKLSVQSTVEFAPQRVETVERIAAGQGRPRKFVLIK